MTSHETEISGDWGGFQPRPYLEQWYRQVTPEITATLDFLRAAHGALPPGALVLDVCSGPTIYQFLAAAPRAAAIHASDYLPQNLAELGRWLEAAPGAFDWSPVIAEALRLELGRPPQATEIAGRAAEVRRAVTELLPCDLRQAQPLGPSQRPIYDALSMCYGADSIFATLPEWEAAMRRCCAALKPGGALIAAVIKNASWWALGGRRMQAVPLDEASVAAALGRIGFAPASLDLRAEQVAAADSEGYDEIIFITARLAATGLTD
ncbi:MAG TPA: guanitoxin biosynthesis pre-guanitoxin forming N-methyltransferase GntF [Herpetosiphonaceae bacterium]